MAFLSVAAPFRFETPRWWLVRSALQRLDVALGLVGGTWVTTEKAALKIWGISGLEKD
jgi:hypothetical protein